MRSYTKSGFTLIELMITVAIIGIMASIAIPNFLRYQLNSKRGESKSNMHAIAELQNTYFTEYNRYVSVPLSQPGGGTPGVEKRVWTAAANTAFGTLGWAPEGGVFYDYDVNVDMGVCPQLDCFTSAAYGDLDGNGALSVVMYVRPDAMGNQATTLLAGMLGAPVEPATGRVIINEVATNFAADQY
jgi:type IV pilus assembly protein PilA